MMIDRLRETGKREGGDAGTDDTNSGHDPAHTSWRNMTTSRHETDMRPDTSRRTLVILYTVVMSYVGIPTARNDAGRLPASTAFYCIRHGIGPARSVGVKLDRWVLPRHEQLVQALDT